jgi:Mor family transcriptional regulator
MRPLILPPKSRQSNGMTKLSVEKVQEIRAAHAVGRSAKELAARYGVHVTTIRRIVRRRTWSDV